jgi:hypothetical protein
LALFLALDLDTMVVMRTAPTQSWANHVERVMSVLNLGLQGVALAWDMMDEDFEKAFKKCNGMAVVRKAAEAYKPAGAELVGAEPVGVEPAGAELAAVELVGAEPVGAEVDMVETEGESEEEVVIGSDSGSDHKPRSEGSSSVQCMDGDEDFAFDWEVEVEEVEVQAQRAQPTQPEPPSTELTDESANPFIITYMSSIEAARCVINGQWRECKWDHKKLSTEVAATRKEVCLVRHCFIHT